MKKVLLTLLLVMGFAFPTLAQDSGRTYYTPLNGESPFPWGSESPFPWHVVDGLWKSTTSPLYFKFDAIRVNTTTRYLSVRLYDRAQNELASGVGVIRKDQIIRAKVVGGDVDAYALVRAYNPRHTGRTCGSNDCVMVVTLRGKDAASSKDLHYLLQRVPNLR